MSKTRRLFALFLLIGCLFGAKASQALVIYNDQEINIKADDQVNGTVFAIGGQIVVDQPLPGDLICLGQDVFVNQPVAGDILCLANNLQVNAEVGGNLRSIANIANLNSLINGNLNLLSAQAILEQDNGVVGESLVASLTLDSQGYYQQGFYSLYNQAKLSGHYQGLVKLRTMGGQSSGLEINDQAKIEQDLIYYSQQPAEISDQAEIIGLVSQQESVGFLDNHWGATKWLWLKLLSLFMLLVFGLTWLGLWPSLGPRLLIASQQHWFKLSIQGLLALIVLPVLAFVLLFTLIGLPVALVVFMVWLVLLYGAKTVFGYWLGSKIVPQAKNHLWPLLLGLIVVELLAWLPVVGWLISNLVIWWSVGVIWQTYRYSINKK